MDYREPLEISAGDTIEWTRSLSNYPASDGWVLKYALRGPAVINVESAADGDDHLVTVAADVNPAWPAGVYYLQGYVEKGTERRTVYTGQITVTPNLVAAAEAFDGRSHAQKVIDAIEAVIEGRATIDQQEMQIDGDRLVRMPFDDLIKVRQRYRNELRNEQNKQRRKQGRGSRRLIKFQM